jgi:hypothetical protein
VPLVLIDDNIVDRMIEHHTAINGRPVRMQQLDVLLKFLVKENLIDGDNVETTMPPIVNDVIYYEYCTSLLVVHDSKML